MQNTIILLIEQIVVALGGEFKLYLPQLIPHMLRVFMHDNSTGRSVTIKVGVLGVKMASRPLLSFSVLLFYEKTADIGMRCTLFSSLTTAFYSDLSNALFCSIGYVLNVALSDIAGQPLSEAKGPKDTHTFSFMFFP